MAPRGKSRNYLTLPWVEPFADPDVFAHPAILSVLDRAFAQEYVMVQLGADVAEPGAENQEVHRDYRPLFDRPNGDAAVRARGQLPARRGHA